MDGYTLDQFRVFVTVAAEGSFAAAARRLNRAQSAITYTLQKLEAQSGVLLFDRSTYRPRLTEAGRILLAHARRVVEDASAFGEYAHGINQGLEARVSLGVDPFVPHDMLIPVLHEFQSKFPGLQMHIASLPFGGVPDAVIDGLVDFGITNDFALVRRSLDRNIFCEVELVPVVAPGHPLAQLDGPIAAESLLDHVQLVMTQTIGPADQAEFGVHAVNRWYVTDAHMKKALICEGAGWGSLPRHMVKAEVASGCLIALNVERWQGSDQLPNFNLSVAWRNDRPLGPAGRWLVKALSIKEGDRLAMRGLVTSAPSVPRVSPLNTRSVLSDNQHY